MAKKKPTRPGPSSSGILRVCSDPAEVGQSISSISNRRFDFLSKRKTILLSALIFGLVLLVFFPATRNDFFYWYGDDPGYVTDNVNVKKGITFESVKWAFTNIDLGNWHPLTFLSHILDCHIYGLKPWGHHLTSVLFHSANALLLFLVLRKMTGALGRSLIVALLFGLHPLRVESVAWVAERKDVLAAFFWLLTMWFYARFVEESKAQNPKSSILYALTLFCFACGLMSKGIVVTLPFALLLLDYWPLQRYEQKSLGRLLWEKIPLVGLAIATSVITFVAQKNWGFVQTVEKYSLLTRLENAVVSYMRYVGKMFWPLDLCGYYPHPGKWPMGFVLIALVFVVGISVVLIVARRKQPWLSVGWFWYLGTLVPVIGIVQLGDVAMADRYSYLPMIGFLIALIWGIQQWTKGWNQQVIIASAAVGAFLIFCTVISMKQITYFKDGVTAWRRSFQVTKEVDVAHVALGLSLDKQGRTEEAIETLQAVVKARPHRPDVHFNLATIFQEHGRFDEAIAHYGDVLRLSSGSNDARYNLGLCLLQTGRTDEAAFQFQEMIRMNRDFKAYNALGTVQASTGKLDDAIASFRAALKQKPDYTEAHNNLGIALADKGMVDEAILHFQEALRLEPNSTLARSYLESLQQTGKAPAQ